MVNHHVILWLTLTQTYLTMFQLCSQQLGTYICAYVTYTKPKILQIAVLDDFLTSTLIYVRKCTLKQSVRQIRKASNVTCFSFHVLYPSSYDFKS